MISIVKEKEIYPTEVPAATPSIRYGSRKLCVYEYA
jgi:hypothetical protein